MTAGLRAAYRADWLKAHEVLFARRHEHPFAPYHRLMMADFWSAADLQHLGFALSLGFRLGVAGAEAKVDLFQMPAVAQPVLDHGEDEVRQPVPLRVHVLERGGDEHRPGPQFATSSMPDSPVGN
jgi:hypothetical protein